MTICTYDPISGKCTKKSGNLLKTHFNLWNQCIYCCLQLQLGRRTKCRLRTYQFQTSLQDIECCTCTYMHITIIFIESVHIGCVYVVGVLLLLFAATVRTKDEVPPQDLSISNLSTRYRMSHMHIHAYYHHFH